jgi:hypothetical protein
MNEIVEKSEKVMLYQKKSLKFYFEFVQNHEM